MLLNLPTELLLQILEYFDYWDLNLVIPLVCKRFKLIMSDYWPSATMNQTLFRENFKPNPRHLLKYQPWLSMKTHPVLEMIQYEPGGSIFDVLFGDSNANDKEYGRGCKRLVDFASVGQENATSPAVNEIYLHIITGGRLGVVHGTGKGGAVTIFDIIERIIRRARHKKYFKYPWIGRYRGVDTLLPCNNGIAELYIYLSYCKRRGRPEYMLRRTPPD